MFLFFDTETNGLPANYKAPMTDTANWPRVIQLAWSYCDEQGNLIESNTKLIKPDGWIIPEEKFWLDNGYSTEKNTKNGFPLKDILEDFLVPLNECKYIIAHNMSFDYNILGCEMIRLGMKANNKPVKMCTKEIGTNFCRLPGNYGQYKWPKLEELHTKLFGEGFEGAHDAMNDVKALEKCFFELLRIGVIKL